MTQTQSQIIQSCSLPSGGCDFREVLALCRPHMEALCDAQQPEDWLLYTYEFLRAAFFPDNFQVQQETGWTAGVYFFLDVLNGMFERERAELAFDPLRDFRLMRPEEEPFCFICAEYERFRHCCTDGYVYAFMRLSRVCTPFETLGHVAGVHHVAMTMARQLLNTELQVDPGLMSGAAMLHDMGKFGCRPSESRRVPYLHYYYTYQFCEKYHLPQISAIASNHSVWDLELENLSVESLLLIYADFRVKSVYDEQHKEHIRFWTLDEAYDVILSKLDNVDEAKKLRYAKVYAKLKDFENYMVYLGCSTDLISPQTGKQNEVPAVFASPQELVDRCKYRAIRANLAVMHQISHADRFLGVLEDIRSEKDWRHVRSFLAVVEEYSAYLSQDQKDMTLRFLYDMMSHRDGDIRRQAARAAGRLLAGYELHYTKEVPAGCSIPSVGRRLSEVWRCFLRDMVQPGYQVSDRHKRWIGYGMKSVLGELLGEKDIVPSVLRIYAQQCNNSAAARDELAVFMLLDGAADIPVDACNAGVQQTLEQFAADALSEGGLEIRVSALRFFLTWLRQGWKGGINLHELIRKVYPAIDEEIYCIRYLAARIREFYGVPSERGLGIYDLTPLYTENQRAEMPWICKYVNLEILKIRHGMQDDEGRRYQYASHLLHMLQFADRIVNRLQAGEDLIRIVPLLTPPQRYEIVLELVHALEAGEYASAKYIPGILGRVYYCLPLQERQEFLQQFQVLLGRESFRVQIVTLETIGVILEHHPGGNSSAEEASALLQEQELAEGLLCREMVHYNEEIASEALYVMGLHLFGSSILSSEQKKMYFSHLARKQMAKSEDHTGGLYLYYHAAAMQHVYRFISDYLLSNGQLPFVQEDLPAAFFPGTFDPFSLGHKAIVQQLHQMGMRVYLAVDEFSWSKKTQPYRIRRKILQMAAADLRDVYIFPEETPVNIANARDLQLLTQMMGGRKPYIVAGSDVVEHASAYTKTQPGSVREFPHIIFTRGSDDTKCQVAEGRILGEIRYMKLPDWFAGISSTNIREAITSGKDISTMVDPVVQHYIYASGIYSMEPTYKKAARVTPIDTFYTDQVSAALRGEITQLLGRTYTAQDEDKILYLRDAAQGGVLCGVIMYRDLDRAHIFSVCGDLELAQTLRAGTSGRVALITAAGGLVTDTDDKKLTVVNELLVNLQEEGYSYVLCFDPDAYGIREALTLHGAVTLEKGRDCLILDLRNPLVVFYNTPESVKEPLAGRAEVVRAIRRAHLRLLQAVSTIYPGNLVLSFDSNIINYRLIKMITDENQVAPVPYQERHLGEKICVPFGKILKGVLVPNTVTKGLDMEKVYEKELHSFQIAEFPGYAPLDIQIRTIRSFDRPVILVDDLYHMSYRKNEIDRYMEQAGMKEDVLLVGVLSGHGADLAQYKNMHVRAAYNVPNMRHWFIEGDLFPFLGGDGVKTQKDTALAGGTSALPSITQILPYCIPKLPGNVSYEAIYHLSEVCLENAADIYRALERVYAEEYERKLTLERLGEVIAEPRIPDTYTGDMSKEPSRIIQEELKTLRRLSHV